jgi:hypothetical protein
MTGLETEDAQDEEGGSQEENRVGSRIGQRSHRGSPDIVGMAAKCPRDIGGFDLKPATFHID